MPKRVNLCSLVVPVNKTVSSQLLSHFHCHHHAKGKAGGQGDGAVSKHLPRKGEGQDSDSTQVLGVHGSLSSQPLGDESEHSRAS